MLPYCRQTDCASTPVLPKGGREPFKLSYVLVIPISSTQGLYFDWNL